MPESFPLNQPPTDPAEIEARRKKWEAQKRKSTVAEPRDVGEGHSASITTHDEFSRQLVNRGARDIARKLAHQKSKAAEVPHVRDESLSPSPYAVHSAPAPKESGKKGLAGWLQKIFPQFGRSEIAAPSNSIAAPIESRDVIDRIAARPERGEVDITRYIEGLEQYCHELDTLLNTRYQNVATEYMQEEIAIAQRKLEEWKRLVNEVHEVLADERSNIPFYVKGVQEAFGDASELVRRLSLRKFN